MDCWRCRAAPGSVLPMKTQILVRGSQAPLVHHLRPVTSQSPVAASRTMLDSMLVASELATAGSVMAKQDLISPASRGASQAACCSGVPYFISTCGGDVSLAGHPDTAPTSMLPVSGAEQLNTSGAYWDKPIT